MPKYTVIYLDEDHAYFQPDELPVRQGYVIATGLSFDAALDEMAKILKAEERIVIEPIPTE